MLFFEIVFISESRLVNTFRLEITSEWNLKKG